jgi:hypothetical protein
MVVEAVEAAAAMARQQVTALSPTVANVLASPKAL